MTIFALIACAFALIKISIDPMAGGERFGGHISGGLGGLAKANLAHQEIAATPILKGLGDWVVLAKENACSYKGCVVRPNRVKFVDD